MLILASGSPRRKELLNQINCNFICKTGNALEFTAKDEPNPSQLVMKNALLKAKSVCNTQNTDDIILGFDTVVALNEQIYGKPQDNDDAIFMLKTLSGNTHQVYTGVVLINQGKIWQDYCVTDVTMEKLSDEEILNYIKTGEPKDKAGAYAIQGLASIYIKKINGCYFNVVGLPLNCLYNLFKKANVKL